jgi:hypothetical protein
MRICSMYQPNLEEICPKMSKCIHAVVVHTCAVVVNTCEVVVNMCMLAHACAHTRPRVVYTLRVCNPCNLWSSVVCFFQIWRETSKDKQMLNHAFSHTHACTHAQSVKNWNYIAHENCGHPSYVFTKFGENTSKISERLTTHTLAHTRSHKKIT